MASTAKGDLLDALISQSVNLHQGRPGRYAQSASAQTKTAVFDDHRPSTAAVPSPSANQSERRRRQSPASVKQGDRESLVDDGIEGWGDFDADQLLAEPEDNNKDSSSSSKRKGGSGGLRLDAYLKAMGNARPLSRRDKSRRERQNARYSAPSTMVSLLEPDQRDEEPARSRTAHNQLDIGSWRPTTAVLRQRQLEAIEFDLPVDKTAAHVRKRMALVSGQRRRQTSTTQQPADLTDLCLPLVTQSLSVVNAPEDSSKPTLDTHDPTEELAPSVVRDRLLALWAAMALSFDPADPATPVHQQTRSTFECSMTVLKLCKSVGIDTSLAPASRTSMAFWRRSSRAREQSVGFDEFLEFVAQSILHPALRHFKLDRSADEYTSTIDSIVDNLIEEPDASAVETAVKGDLTKKVKELGDVHPLLPLWKAGIASGNAITTRRPPEYQTRGDAASSGPRLQEAATQQPRDHDENDPEAAPTPISIASGQTRVVQRAAPGQSIDEAKDAHGLSIQRVVQLRSSWKRKPALNNEQARAVNAVAALSSTVLELERDDLEAKRVGRVLETTRAPDVDASGLQIGPSPSQLPPVAASCATDNNSHADQGSASPAKEEPETPVLLCSACLLATALLWCAPCFSVLCESCWQEIHHSTVDLPHVGDGPLGAADSPFCPTVRPLRSRSDSSPDAPSVPMVYLPTKATSPVRNPIRGGGGVGDAFKRRAVADDDIDPPTVAGDVGLVSHAILPAVLPPTKPSGRAKLRRSQSVDEGVSLADLTKSLMLGARPRQGGHRRWPPGSDSASSASQLPSSASPSPWSTASPCASSTTEPPRPERRSLPGKQRLRPTLRSSPVVLDASQLLPSNVPR